MDVSIYTLTIKGSNIFYVGSTDNIESRLKTHRYKLTLGGLKSERTKYIIEPLEVVEKSERFYWERFYIEQMKQWGFVLLNKNKINVDSKQFSKPSQQLKYPFDTMEVGDSFSCASNRVRDSIYYFTSKKENAKKKFVCRKTEDNKMRVWRTK